MRSIAARESGPGRSGPGRRNMLAGFEANLFAALGAPDRGPLNPHAPAARRHLPGLVTVLDGLAFRIVLARSGR